jgi:integrase
MPEKIDTTHQIIDRQLIVYKRPTTDVWQCRFKVGGEWIVRTTKERELEKAKVAAHKLMLKAEVRLEQNFTPATKKFKDVATLALKEMEKKTDAGDGKVSYDQYKRITLDYLIPFFGNRDIDNITPKVLEEYARYRNEKVGKELAYSTVRKHNVTLNRIFEEAILRGFMTTTQKPYLETKGKKSQTYPTFDVDEVNIILSALPDWVNRGRNEYKRELRQILSEYVAVLIDTGARPGKELLELQWKNVKITKVYSRPVTRTEINELDELVEVPVIIGTDEEGEPIIDSTWEAELLIYVEGKTDGRTANAFTETFKILKGIVERRYPGKELRNVISDFPDEFVFSDKEGKICKSFNHMFEAFLDEHSLLKEKNTNRNRVFYSLRSTHSTTAMNLDGVDVRALALQMGNSPPVMFKHYDRADGAAITDRVRAPNARRALFKQVEIPSKNISTKKSSSGEKK